MIRWNFVLVPQTLKVTEINEIRMSWVALNCIHSAQLYEWSHVNVILVIAIATQGFFPFPSYRLCQFIFQKGKPYSKVKIKKK